MSEGRIQQYLYPSILSQNEQIWTIVIYLLFVHKFFIQTIDNMFRTHSVRLIFFINLILNAVINDLKNSKICAYEFIFDPAESLIMYDPYSGRKENRVHNAETLSYPSAYAPRNFPSKNFAMQNIFLECMHFCNFYSILIIYTQIYSPPIIS